MTHGAPRYTVTLLQCRQNVLCFPCSKIHRRKGAHMERKAPESSSKLTLKILGVEPKKVLEAPAPRIPLARIYGKAFKVGSQTDIERGQEYTYFSGSFEGHNMQDGTVITAPRLYLPGHVSDMVEKVIHDAQRKDKHANVGFVVEIRAVKSPNARSGFEYEAEFLMKPESQDELQALRDIASAPHKGKTTEITQGSKSKTA